MAAVSVNGVETEFVLSETEVTAFLSLFSVPLRRTRLVHRQTEIFKLAEREGPNFTSLLERNA